jgi:hypothetical protein
MTTTPKRTTFDRRFPSIACTRCGEDRWPSTRVVPYTCQRCQQALAGQSSVVDPVPSAARQASGRRLNEALSASSNRPGQHPTLTRTSSHRTLSPGTRRA